MIHISDSGEAPLPFGDLSFKYAMTDLRHGLGVMVFADTRAELVAYLITGRPIDDAELSATQLLRFAEITAVHLQESSLTSCWARPMSFISANSSLRFWMDRTSRCSILSGQMTRRCR